MRQEGLQLLSFNRYLSKARGGDEMNKARLGFLFIVCLLIGLSAAQAEVSSKLVGELKLTSPPKYVEISFSGQRIYVLDEIGNLLIYNLSGQLTDTLAVGKDIDQVKVSPRDDFVFLSSSTQKSVQIIALTFTREIDISGSPFQGPANAPIAIVVFSDFECPYCARVGSIIDQIRQQYPKEVKSVFKHFPLPNHKHALAAAKASIAADAQGKFWEFHDQLFKNYSQLNDQKIEEIRIDLGLDKARFHKVMEAPQTMQKIVKDRQEGEAAEVRGTPTIFVNGRMVRPASQEGIKEAVEEALKAGVKK
jgi:protein-disulfide isomerase